jgi:hypothetical protein
MLLDDVDVLDGENLLEKDDVVEEDVYEYILSRPRKSVW